MKSIFILLFCFILTVSCNQPKDYLQITVSNPTKTDLVGTTFRITEPELLDLLRISNGLVSIKADGITLPFQVIETEGKIKAILVLASLKAGEDKTMKIIPTDKVEEFRHLTQAEISVKEGGEWVWVTKNNGNQQWEYRRGNWKNVQEFTVPEQHTDHSFDIRYEGPGWESDKIGYRFYLDWRNANDIFGKKVDTLVLQSVGIDGFDSYHQMSGWGVDNFQVGNSLGIGSIGFWADGKANRVEKADTRHSKVDYSGVLESKITTTYKGWETAEGRTDLVSELSIRAGSYLTKNDLSLSAPLPNLCTGIIKLDSTAILKYENPESEWAYLATFGVQSLEKDNMGVAVFYKRADLIEVTADKLSHVIVLKPEGNKLTWYFGSLWEQDQSKVKTIEEFKKFLDGQVDLLNRGII